MLLLKNNFYTEYAQKIFHQFFVHSAVFNIFSKVQIFLTWKCSFFYWLELTIKINSLTEQLMLIIKQFVNGMKW